MSKFDVITIGGATKDFFLWSRQGLVIDNKQDLTRQRLFAFEYGAKIYVDRFCASLGGGAMNIATGLARLGFKVAPLVCLNKDEKVEYNWVIEQLKKEKINTSLIQSSNKGSIGASFILINDRTGEHTIFSYRGVNHHTKITTKRKLYTDWIYLTSISGKNTDRKLKTVGQIVKQQNIKLVFNPGSSQISTNFREITNLCNSTEILILNRDESIELTLSTNAYNQAPHIDVLLKKLHALGPKIVAVTDGRHGAYAYDGHKTYHCRAPFVKKPVDTTGAGDAFGSGFLAGIMRYNNIEKALNLGIKNGASVIQAVGAQIKLLKK